MSSESNLRQLPHSVFTAPQIMTLQAQVKAFKELSTRYTELESATKTALQAQVPAPPSNGPEKASSNGSKKSLPVTMPTPPTQPSTAAHVTSTSHSTASSSKTHPPAKTNPPPVPAPVKAVVPPPPPHPPQTISLPPPTAAPAVPTPVATSIVPPPPTPAIPTPQPSWQCFGSLLFCAPTSIPNIDLKKDNLETISVSYQVSNTR